MKLKTTKNVIPDSLAGRLRESSPQDPVGNLLCRATKMCIPPNPRPASLQILGLPSACTQPPASMTSKRGVLWMVVTAFFLGFLSLQGLCQQQKEKDLPNVLWLVIEDMSPQFLGAYGNKTVKTPAMDNFMEQAVRFDAAFSTGALCSPSRYTIITGTRTYEYGTGHHRSLFPIPGHIEGFPKYLREAGYYTTNNYKTDYNHAEHWPMTRSSWDENSQEAGWWSRAEGQPFFSVFNFNNTHQSRTFTNPYPLYEEQVLDHLAPNERIAAADIELPAFYKDTPALQKELSRTYNALKKVDKEIDTLLTRLEKEGLKESTLIFFYSDHGGGSLRSKGQPTSLGYRVPFAVWVPEKYRHMVPWKMGETMTEPVCFEDLAPTMLSIAGIPVPRYMKGRPFIGTVPEESRNYIVSSVDRSGEAPDLSRSITDGQYIYTRIFRPDLPEAKWQKYFDFSQSRQLMRNYAWKGKLDTLQSAMFGNRPIESLYHIKDDPWQIKDLARDPAYGNKLAEMRKALDRHLLASKDVMFIPEYEAMEISKSTTLHEFRQSPYYPFEEIYRVASLVGKEGTSEEQLKYLQSGNKFIRFWAAVGLGLHKHAKRDLNILKRALEDDSPPVSIEIAAILFKQGKDKKAARLLRAMIWHENPYLTWQAMYHILNMERSVGVYFHDDVAEMFKVRKKEKGYIALALDAAELYLFMHDGRPLYYERFW